MPAYDIHQHLWPEGVLHALQSRTEPPFARRDGALWTITLATEAPFTVDPADHDPQRRAGELAARGIDRALVALSSAIGIETLPAGEAVPILAAWRHATASLPDAMQPWAAVALRTPAADQVAAADKALDGGAAGVCIPAAALASRRGLDALRPLLARLEDRLAPVFVHPGAPDGSPGDAPWWGPATAYVAELHAAWHAFAAWGRSAHPRLHVVYAALAGLAPLHGERTAGRGGPAPDSAHDPLSFYDTSSYGPRAARAMACVVGSSQLVYGSDHPVLAIEGHDELQSTQNAARLLGLEWAVA